MVLLPCNIFKSVLFSYRLAKHQAFSGKNPNPPLKHWKKNKQRKYSSVWQACGWYTDCDVESFSIRSVAYKVKVSRSRIWFHVFQMQNGSRTVKKLFTQKKLWCSQEVSLKRDCVQIFWDGRSSHFISQNFSLAWTWTWDVYFHFWPEQQTFFTVVIVLKP